ncbi:MAG: hypothetical protein GX660_06710 [Clostridiaceae bacterium]|nr:hypothetical protein [Clostridiaceae bacterium]
MKAIETVFVVILFLIYLGLWKLKQINQKKNTGIDPKVMANTLVGKLWLTKKLVEYQLNLIKK